MVNDAYNALWVRANNIRSVEELAVSQMLNRFLSKEFAQPYMTVWLKNIDRLLSVLHEEINQYRFIDVGCGRGIPAFYVAKEYNFKKIEGFDFEDSLIEGAKLNAKSSEHFKEVNFFVADAQQYRLSNEKTVVFMFNPFDAPVMEAFMRNNIDTLRATRSKIAYANYHQLETILKFEPVHMHDIKDYRCALISF